MPIPTQAQILNSIKDMIAAVGDTGLILSRERNIESAAELINIFRGLNEGIMHGWLIRNLGTTQIREGGPCDIVRTIKYSLETLYPFDDKPFSGIDSHGRFRLMVEAVVATFNAEPNWGLGFAGPTFLLEHQMLQATDDYQVMSLGEGADSHLIHYATFDLEVNLSFTARG